MSTGWVKLHRKIFENKIVCKDSDHFMVWCYLLTNAIHSTYPIRFNGENIELQAGQLVTSLREIENETGVPKTTVQRIMKLFEEKNQIAMKKTFKKTLITITNWNEYQNNEKNDDKKVGTLNSKNRDTENEKSGTLKNVVDKSCECSNINNKNVDNFSKNEKLGHWNCESWDTESEKVGHCSINKNDIYKNDYSNTNKTNTTNTSNYSNRDIQDNSVVSVVALNKVLEEFKAVKPTYTVADINTAKQVLEDYSEEEIINAIHTSAVVQQLTGEEINGFGAIRYLLNRKNKANTS